jgi:uracil-DNA glycosylase
VNLRQHTLDRLESLAAAGVEWLPRARPLEIRFAEAPTTPVAIADPVTDRRVALEQLRTTVAACNRCPDLFATRTQTVFGVGPLSADLCIIGEAPGSDEDQQGEPFVGKAGQLLTRILEASGFRRDEVYICNVLRCRPPQNATPTPTQCENCRPFLERQLELVKPKLICTMGNTPTKNLLGITDGITKTRGRFFDYRGTPVMPTYHPSYLLRDAGSPKQRQAKGECWQDFQAIVARLGRSLPGKS